MPSFSNVKSRALQSASVSFALAISRSVLEPSTLTRLAPCHVTGRDRQRCHCDGRSAGLSLRAALRNQSSDKPHSPFSQHMQVASPCFSRSLLCLRLEDSAFVARVPTQCHRDIQPAPLPGTLRLYLKRACDADEAHIVIPPRQNGLYDISQVATRHKHSAVRWQHVATVDRPKHLNTPRSSQRIALVRRAELEPESNDLEISQRT